MRRKFYILGFALAAVLTGFFVMRLVFAAFVWMDPDRGVHAIEGWMTPRYIARTYDISREEIQSVLQLAEGETPRMPLIRIAKQRGIPVAELIAEIEAMIGARPAVDTSEPGPALPPRPSP